jgi:protein-tyrosine phosphatase
MSSEVVRGLHQGDARDAELMLREWAESVSSGHDPRYDALVLCAEEVQFTPRSRSKPPIHHLPLRDEPVPLTLRAREATAATARRVARRVLQRQRVLVTCAMGLNRSGLVSALALRAMGAEPATAVTLVRRARGPMALSNDVFEQLVYTMSLAELKL